MKRQFGFWEGFVCKGMPTTMTNVWSIARILSTSRTSEDVWNALLKYRWMNGTCLDASKEWCDSNSDCVSFETHEAGSKSVPPTGNIQFSTSCLSNDKPGGDCGHILYIKNKSNTNNEILN